MEAPEAMALGIVPDRCPHTDLAPLMARKKSVPWASHRA